MKATLFANIIFALSILPASAQTIQPLSVDIPNAPLATNGATIHNVLFPRLGTAPNCPYDWRRPTVFHKKIDASKQSIRLQSFFILNKGLTQRDGHYIVAYGQGYQFPNVETGNPCKVSSEGSTHMLRGVGALLTANGIAIERWKGPEANNADVWHSPNIIFPNTKELPPGGYWLRLSIEPTQLNAKTVAVSVELFNQGAQRLDLFSRPFAIQDIFPFDDYVSGIIAQAQMNQDTEFYAFDYF